LRNLDKIKESFVLRKTRGHQLSSLLSTPFRMPDTPVHGRAALELAHDILEADPSLTLDNTIIFNNPDLWEEGLEIQPSTTSRTKKASSNIAGHKRKHVLDDVQDTVNSQRYIRSESSLSTVSTSKRYIDTPRVTHGSDVDLTWDSRLRHGKRPILIYLISALIPFRFISSIAVFE